MDDSIGYRVNELERKLREDYLSGPQIMNAYPTRQELAEHAKTQREWWPIVVMVIASGTGIANLILALKGGR